VTLEFGGTPKILGRKSWRESLPAIDIIRL